MERPGKSGGWAALLGVSVSGALGVTSGSCFVLWPLQEEPGVGWTCSSLHYNVRRSPWAPGILTLLVGEAVWAGEGLRVCGVWCVCWGHRLSRCLCAPTG